MIAPTKIGKYEIRRQIGRGAMGVVFEAFDPVIERLVAIKILRLELFEHSQIADVRARFKREAQSAGQLAHPHIVTVYDYGDHEGTPYIIMELLTGNELSKSLGRGSRLPLSEIVRLMTQLLGALSYAHERKVVHRDVKPGNIFILDDGSLKVVDFGLAHVEASNLTDSGALLGTPAYMSPEQFLALPIDERSDIYSAGVILYELLTGEKPFTGSVTSIMQKVLRQEPIEPSVLNPTIPTAWDTVIKRAMAKKPDARFSSARQFSETIKQVFEKGALNVSVEVTFTGSKTADLAGETLCPTPVKQQVSKAQQPMPPVSVGPVTEPEKSSSKKALAIAATAVVIAVGAATFYWSQLPREELVKEEPVAKVVPIDDAGVAEKAAAERVTADKATADAKVVIEKAASDAKAAAERIAQETKLAQERAAQKKAAEEKKATEKAQVERMAAERVQADKLVAAKAAKLPESKNAAEKARVEKEIKEKVSAEATQQEKLRIEKDVAERQAKEKAEADKITFERRERENASLEKESKLRTTAGAKPGWPVVGDRWRYRGREIDGSVTRPWVEGNWVVVKEITGNVIIESQVNSAGKLLEPRREPGVAIISLTNHVYILSPYLHVQQPIKVGDAWPDVPYKVPGNCTNNDFTYRCQFSAKVVGREKVTVPAGTFDAYRVDVRQNVSGAGLVIVRDGVFWYSPEAKRYAKITWRTVAGNWTSPDTDVELLSLEVK